MGAVLPPRHAEKFLLIRSDRQMLFNWESQHHGKCIVNSSIDTNDVSVIIAWGTEHDGDSVEYRIENVGDQKSDQRLDRATRYAMGHFDSSSQETCGLLNLSVDNSSCCFEGPLPAVLT